MAGEGELILINTNFSLGNPALLNREEQFRLMVDRLGHPAERIHEWQSRELEGMHGLVELANHLANHFPEAMVVVRPHPFERLETYAELLDRRPNLRCVRDGTIGAWLLRARVVIQRSCSTSIEAAMLGVPAFSPSWLSTAFERPAANDTSVMCGSKDEMFARVDEVLAGRFALPSGVAHRSATAIRNWFFQIDGQAHARVAEVVLNHLPTAPRPNRLRACRRAVYTRAARFPSTRWIKGSLRSALGLPPDWTPLRQRARRQPYETTLWRESLKRFDTLSIRELTTEFAELPVTGTPRYRVDAAPADTERDYLDRYRFGNSIKLTPAAL
jgi:hypothetical protein